MSLVTLQVNLSAYLLHCHPALHWIFSPTDSYFLLTGHTLQVNLPFCLLCHPSQTLTLVLIGLTLQVNLSAYFAIQHTTLTLVLTGHTLQVNLSAFFAIQHTSSLTFKVAGTLKNVMIILWGMFVMLEHVSWLQLLGYGVSLAGFGLYTHTQLRKKLQKSVLRQ